MTMHELERTRLITEQERLRSQGRILNGALDDVKRREKYILADIHERETRLTAIAQQLEALPVASFDELEFELGEAQEVLKFLEGREPRFDESPDWLKDCLMRVEQVVIGIAELIRERKQ